MVRLSDDPDEIREMIQRMLELYSMEELLTFDDLPVEDALELLIQYGALSFDNVPV